MSTGLRLPIYIVDAFTDVAFHGNPAAVCPLPNEPIGDETFQNIAAEMNLSEVAYIRRLHDGDTFETNDTFGLRWFTPLAEVKLCGHATLASAAVLFNTLGNKSEKIVFKTKSGDLIVRRHGNQVHMDFPLGRTVQQDISEWTCLIKCLGDVSTVHEIVHCESLNYLLVRLKDGWSRKEFEELTPAISSMMSAAARKLVVLVVTMRGSPDQGFADANDKPYDFVSRSFCPWTGVNEDPVTGSAQTVLVDYWSKICGKTEFYTRQCSKRGGEISLKLSGDRVHIVGSGVVVMEGTFKL